MVSIKYTDFPLEIERLTARDPSLHWKSNQIGRKLSEKLDTGNSGVCRTLVASTREFDGDGKFCQLQLW